jgi:hypothetical protein
MELEFHHCVHKNSPFVPTLSQTNPVHDLFSGFFIVHFNITLPNYAQYNQFLTLISPFIV